jgi:hypothetical protein
MSSSSSEHTNEIKQVFACTTKNQAVALARKKKFYIQVMIDDEAKRRTNHIGVLVDRLLGHPIQLKCSMASSSLTSYYQMLAYYKWLLDDQKLNVMDFNHILLSELASSKANEFVVLDEKHEHFHSDSLHVMTSFPNFTIIVQNKIWHC